METSDVPTKGNSKLPDRPSLKYERTEDIISEYANNAFLESSAWDMRIVFGQLDQANPKAPVIKQKVAITLPWAQAKLLQYYLQLHIDVEESQDGPIHIRPELIPAEPDKPKNENDPREKALYEIIRRRRAEFMASLKKEPT
jgi:hypothetical protein